MEYNERKLNRLKDHDYSSNGMYFVTICTKERIPYLSEICYDFGSTDTFDRPNVGNAALGVPQAVLTAIGKIVDSNIRKINELYRYVSVEKYVIMPDHIHLILFISDYEEKSDGTPRAAFPTKSIPQIINALKTISTKQIGYSIWQKSYHDHIIRNENEMREIWQYIENNPLNWANHKYDQNLWR